MKFHFRLEQQLTIYSYEGRCARLRNLFERFAIRRAVGDDAVDGVPTRCETGTACVICPIGTVVRRWVLDKGERKISLGNHWLGKQQRTAGTRLP